MPRVSSMVRNANTPGSNLSFPEPVEGPYSPSIGGRKDRLPVAMINWSYGVTWPSSENTTRANRSIRPTRTPACRAMSFSTYHSRVLRKIPSWDSSPDSTWLSMIRL